MKQLRFTTTKPMGMFELISPDANHSPLIVPENIGEFIQDKVRGRCSYIHGEAEGLAGFDIPTYFDGNLGQLDLPIDQQDILMILPFGEYQCKAEYSYHAGSAGAYLITLVNEPSINS